MTKISQGNKKITTRKIPVTNNKVLVRTDSLLFFKKYRQPIIKFWSVPVPVRETVRNIFHIALMLFNNLQNFSHFSFVLTLRMQEENRTYVRRSFKGRPGLS